jgi:hypothetical protein
MDKNYEVYFDKVIEYFLKSLSLTKLSMKFPKNQDLELFKQ